MNDYENMKRRIDESIRKESARSVAIRRKRDERRNIRKGGGGHIIAKSLMPARDEGTSTDTDFSFGHNTVVESIDDRIARESAERCMEKIYCTVCKTYHGYCAEIVEEKEKMKMLPTGDEQSGTKRKGGLNWVTLESLTSQPQEAKILMVKYNAEGKWGASVTLKLAFQGEIKFLNVKPKKTDSRYKLMLDHFGADENNWVDQRITLSAEKDEFSEGYRMKLDLPEPEPQSRKSNTATSGSRR